MSTREDEQRILHEIECALRHGDRLFPARFAFLRTRAALHRTTVRAFLAIEAALLILTAVAVSAGWPTLLIPAVGGALSVPLIALCLKAGPSA